MQTMPPAHPTKLNSFEFRLFRHLGTLPGLRGSRIVVACSGGRDSQALLHAMVRVSGKLGFKVIAAHVNHGSNVARDQAEVEVREAAKKLGLRVSTARYMSQDELKSESELRDFRHAMLEKIRVQTNARYIVFAHHADDLFETRLIRLVRGTGPQGLRAMRFIDGFIVRPWLEETRTGVADYVMESGIHWVEDPSNAESDPLRNWMRNEWLPKLEAKRPGSALAMARSLEAIVQSYRESEFEIMETEHGFQLARSGFQKLSDSEKREALAKLFSLANIDSFAKSHLDEVCKRLTTPQKRFSFSLLKHRFEINAEHVLVMTNRNSNR